MDSGSDGSRLETRVCRYCNMGNADELVTEKAPKILSHELHDVFPIFVNMLDLKSFMKLAMTSKDMHKRCMEDKAIKINVNMGEIEAKEENDSVLFHCPYKTENYIAALRRLPCKVLMNYGTIRGGIETSKMAAFHSYAKEIGVYQICKLNIYDSLEELEAITAIIKDFGVKSLDFHCEISDDIVRSSLQLNLEKINFTETEPFDALVEVDTSIREIYCFGGPTEEQIKSIISKIQSGSLIHVFINWEALDWCDFDSVAANEEGPFPETRPLLLTAEPYIREFREYWFLHADGGVTKCETEDSDYSYLKMYKCEEWEYPWILRKEEDVFKDFEKHQRTSCSASQFHTFSSRFTMIERSHEGPLPVHWPIFFKLSDERFWRFDEEDNLIDCSWEEGFAYWDLLESVYGKEIDHPALAKHVFWKFVKLIRKCEEFTLYCEGAEEFGHWFEKFENLDSEYSDSCPRPLIIGVEGGGVEKEPTPIETRLVLIENHVVECNLSGTKVHAQYCDYFDKLDILFIKKKAMETPKVPCHNDMHFNVRFEQFCNFTSERTATELWFMNHQTITKVVRENGRLSLFRCSSLDECPMVFLKQVFKYCAEREEKLKISFAVEIGQFYSCLELFSIVPFDCEGRLKPDSPLAFVKSETHHTCRKGILRKPRCDCTDLSVLVWFLWDGIKVTHCSWGKGEPKNVVFGKSADFSEIPPALKTKEYLKNLILAKYDTRTKFNWFGRFNEFSACLDEFIRLPFSYSARLPNERPLAFDSYPGEREPTYFILRSDGTVVVCKKMSPTHFLLSSSSDKEQFPPALKNLF